MKTAKLNQHGMSLVEILIGLAIVGLTVMATLAMQARNLSIQKQNQLVNTAQTMQARIRQLLIDGTSWRQTIQHNSTSGMNCLSDVTACAAGQRSFDIYDAAGNIAILSLSNAGASGNGFDQAGAVCTGFGISGGNDACPISYFITWEPSCVGICTNPAVLLRVRMLYKPGNDSPPLNPDKYGIGYPGSPFIRGADSVTKTFQLVHEVAPTAGGGDCSTNPAAPTARNMTVPPGGDPHGLVASAGTTITFTGGTGAGGTYKCSVSATGFAVGGFRALLAVDGVVVGSSVGFAPQWVQSSVAFESTFNVPVTGTHTMQLQQVCSSTPTGGLNAAVDAFALGMPAAPYATNAVYATMVCSLLN